MSSWAVEDVLFRWDSFLTMLALFFSMHPTEESQESLYKLKRITKLPPECIAMAKMKAGIRETQ